VQRDYDPARCGRLMRDRLEAIRAGRREQLPA
jgi:hypothetical protein